MIIAFLLVLIFFLGFRAIGTSTDKQNPTDKMGEMMREDGRDIRGIAIIILVVMGLTMIFL